MNFNPYSHKQITTPLDIRLVDLFVKENKKNNWLSVDDVACWVYQTNNVKNHHRNYVLLKVLNIIGSMYSKEANNSFLESGYTQVNGQREFAYRLKQAQGKKPCANTVAIRSR